MQENLLPTKQAEYLGVSEAFLERDRWAGARVQYIKIGSRAVRYRSKKRHLFLFRTSNSSRAEFVCTK